MSCATVSDVSRNRVLSTVVALAMWCCLPIAFVHASALHTTWDAQYLFVENRFTGDRRRVFELNEHLNTVPDYAKAVRITDASCQTSLAFVPCDVEFLDLATGGGRLVADQLERFTKLRELRIRSEMLAGVSGLSQLDTLEVFGFCAEAARFASECGALEHLAVSGDVDAIALGRLSESLRLKSLRLSGIPWSDPLVHAIAYHVHVEHLNLGLAYFEPGRDYPEKATEQSWDALRSLKRLTVVKASRWALVGSKLIDSSYCGLTPESLVGIVRGRNLRLVDTDIPMQLPHLRVLLSSRYLQWVSVHPDNTQVDFRELLQGATGLKYLRISGVRSGWSGLNHLGQVRHLYLSLAAGMEGPRDLRPFLPHRLETLNILGELSGNAVESLGQWKGAAQCRELKVTIDVDVPTVLSQVMTVLAQMKGLERLDLALSGDEARGVGAEHWKLLGENGRLASLRIFIGDDSRITIPVPLEEPTESRHVFDREAVTAIASLSALRYLDLSYQWFERGALDHLFGDTVLESLSLEGVRAFLSEDVVAMLAASDIAALNLSGTNVSLTATHVKALVEPASRQLIIIPFAGLDSLDAIETIKEFVGDTDVRITGSR